MTEMTAPDLIKHLFEAIGYEEYLLKSEPAEAEARLENVAQLISAAAEPGAAETAGEAGEGGGAPGLQAFLDRASLVSDSESAQGERGANLMTLHAAKGLEFDLVLLAGMEEGLSPHARTLDKDHEIEEERRLVYVGMTRARRRLFLTSALTRRLYASTAPTRLSRFIEEIGAEHLVSEYAGGSSGIGAGAWRGGGSASSRPARTLRRDVTLGDEDLSRHADDEEEAGFRVGHRVRHEQFGVGEVLGVEPTRDGQKLTVRFPLTGVRKMLTPPARLVVVRG
jgi:DNA helicase-2/ATP-dependent DNA helicase PcrA